MSKINVCFCYPFTKPKEPVNLVLFREVRNAIPEEAVREYISLCRQYAKTYHVYLVTGSFVLEKKLCICLIDPEGKPLVVQKASYLNPLQHPSLEPGSRIQVVQTELGALSLLAGVDVFHPETARAAVMQGAETLISVTYYEPYDLNTTREMSGCWAAAQSNRVHVIGVSNLDCCVCAPCAATNDKSEFVLAPQSEFPAVATVYPHKTGKLQEKYSLSAQLNPSFISRYASQLSL